MVAVILRLCDPMPQWLAVTEHWLSLYPIRLTVVSRYWPDIEVDGPSVVIYPGFALVGFAANALNRGT
jgi:hypothetical protein